MKRSKRWRGKRGPRDAVAKANGDEKRVQHKKKQSGVGDALDGTEDGCLSDKRE